MASTQSSFTMASRASMSRAFMRLVVLGVLSMLATAVSLVSFSTPASAAGPAFVGYCTPDVVQPEDGSCVLDEPEGNDPDTYGTVTYDRTVAGAADSLAFDLPAGINATEVQICMTLVADSAANPYVPTSANTCAGNSPDRAYSSSSPTDPVVVDVAAFFAANPAYAAGGALWFTVHVTSSGRTLYVTGGSAPGAPITRSLVVTKDVQPDSAGSFAFTVDCTTPLSAANTTSPGVTFNNDNASFTLADGEAIGFSGIADGDSCVVAESSPGDGWATSANGVVGTSTTVSLAGANGTAAFTNSPLRTLLVSKDVTGATGTHTFDFTVDCGAYALSNTNTANTGVVFTGGDAMFRLGDDESLSFVKIPHATTCTVSETVPATSGGTWATSINGSSDADRAATVVLDQNRTLAYGNAFTADVVAVVAAVAQEAAPVVPEVLGVQVTRAELATTGFASTARFWLLVAFLLLVLGAALLWFARRPQSHMVTRNGIAK